MVLLPTLRANPETSDDDDLSERGTMCPHACLGLSDTALHRNVHIYWHFTASCGGRCVGIKLRACFSVQTEVQASSLYYALFQ